MFPCNPFHAHVHCNFGKHVLEVKENDHRSSHGVMPCSLRSWDELHAGAFLRHDATDPSLTAEFMMLLQVLDLGEGLSAEDARKASTCLPLSNLALNRGLQQSIQTPRALLFAAIESYKVLLIGFTLK